MKLFIVVNNGFENLAKTELTELVKTESSLFPNILECEVSETSKIFTFLCHSQTSRRILVAITKTKEVETLTLPKNFPWPDFFTSKISFKIEVEGVKGQENRFEIARNIAGKVFNFLEPLNISPFLELKNPQCLLIVFFNGKEYFLGIDLAGVELNSRYYRVFPHQASFKGDFGYYLARKSGFKSGEKLIVGQCKDGVIPIEAALFAHQIPVQNTTFFSYQHYHLFKKVNSPTTLSKKKSTVIYAFDEVLPNIIAARKNAKLAKVQEYIDFQKYSLEDLDVKHEEQSFDRIIFHLTSKDEDKINEIYYQSTYLLKPKGTLLLIGRGSWEVSISSKFTLIEEEEIKKGESVHKLWVLQKK
ncbi:hypothetical protein J4421_04690 [Candidatus Woesearchaeota archaeon]|nr:hypothetical protein [Candidatus Woesearchaeota archaeon]